MEEESLNEPLGRFSTLGRNLIATFADSIKAQLKLLNDTVGREAGLKRKTACAVSERTVLVIILGGNGFRDLRDARFARSSATRSP